MSDFTRYRPAVTPGGAVMLPAEDGEWIRESAAYSLAKSIKAKHDALSARLEEAERERLTAARALVKAFNELNAIRARDGVPRDYAGMKVGIDEEYFSSVVDDVDAAVLALTGRGAHCHPLLYERTTDSADAVTCDHFPGQTVCDWCKGTGAIDAPTSADDPSCPDCDGEGHE